MKTFVSMTKKSALAVLAASVLSACGNQSNNAASERYDINSVTGTPAEQAEKVARIGEKMAFTQGVIHLDEIMDRALTLDPQNARAKFYKGTFEFVKTQRGILNRLKPFVVNQLPAEAQQQYLKGLAEMPESDAKDFLLDGPQDIETVAQIQDHLASIRSALLKTRKTYEELKLSGLKLNFEWVNTYQHPEQSHEKCAPKRIADGIYEVPVCDTYKISYEVAEADFEALRQSVSGLVVGYFSLPLAYDATGIMELAKIGQELSQSNVVLTEQQIWDLLRQQEKFLTLRDAQVLRDVKALGLDAVEAVRWAARRQEELCPAPSSNPANPYDVARRPGKLYRDGFCVDKNARYVATIVEGLLTGPFNHVVKNPATGESLATVINASSFFEGGIQDLKSIGPVEFSACGASTKLGDNTLGGVLPRGDLTKIVKTLNPSALNGECK